MTQLWQLGDLELADRARVEGAASSFDVDVDAAGDETSADAVAP